MEVSKKACSSRSGDSCFRAGPLACFRFRSCSLGFRVPKMLLSTYIVERRVFLIRIAIMVWASIPHLDTRDPLGNAAAWSASVACCHVASRPTAEKTTERPCSRFRVYGDAASLGVLRPTTARTPFVCVCVYIHICK